MSFKKLTCTACGTEYILGAGTRAAACNVCGKDLRESEASAHDVKLPDRIVPFAVTKEQSRKSLLTWLSEGDYTPDDVLASSTVPDTNGLFMPVYVFRGKFRGNWSASSGYRRKEKYFEKNSNGELVEKERTVTDWRPSNGQAFGEFSVVSFGGMRNEKNSHAVDATLVHANAARVEGRSSQSFDAQHAQQVSMLPFTQDGAAAWKTSGESSAKSEAHSQVNRSVPGDEHKDLNVHVTYELESTITAWVPCWTTRYEYRGESHRVFIDGSDATAIDGTRPEDKSAREHAKRLFRPAHVTAAVCVGVVLLLAIFSAGLSGAAFLVGAPVTGWRYWRAFQRKKEQLTLSKRTRQEALQAILKHPETALGAAA
jgi:hypothetical protein